MKSASSSNSSTPPSSGSGSAKNAWSKPLQSKPKPPPGLTQNSSDSPKGSTSPSPSPSSVSHETLIALRERFLQTLLLSVGQNVVASLKDGSKVEGILHTATPFNTLSKEHRNKYILKNPSGGKESAVILSMDDVVSLHVKSVRLAEGPQQGFTDTEISRANAAGGTKVLQQAGAEWTAEPSSSGGAKTNSRAEGLLGSAASGELKKEDLKGSIGTWDQFHANEKLFNVKGTYDENLYTTELDKTKLDPKHIRKAERLAREIETSTTTNIHLAEERGQAIQGDYDEEDLYSGVLKDGETRGPTVASEGQPKMNPKMNYAAAAAKTAPPGFKQQKTSEDDENSDEATPSEKGSADKAKSEETKVEEKKAAQKEKSNESGTTSKESKAEEKSKEEQKEAENKEEKKEVKPSSSLKAPSKLNANAKEFTLNINAKSFTPGGLGGGPPAGPPPNEQPPVPPYGYDPNTGMPIGVDPNMPPQFMHPGAPMGQPGKLTKTNE